MESLSNGTELGVILLAAFACTLLKKKKKKKKSHIAGLKPEIKE